MLCSRVQNLLSAYCDRELPGSESLQVRDHLRHCVACREEHEGLLQLRSLMAALPAVEPRRAFDPRLFDQPRRAPQPTWWDRSLQRWRQTLQQAASVDITQRWGPHLALGGVLGVVLLSAWLLQRPQMPDAVYANVPAAVRTVESYETQVVPMPRAVPVDPRQMGIPTRPMLLPVAWSERAHLRGVYGSNPTAEAWSHSHEPYGLQTVGWRP